MIVKKLTKFCAVAAAALLMTTAATAGITQTGTTAGLFIYDVEDLAGSAGGTGTAFSTITGPLGISFGEKFLGQINTPSGDFDIISGTPSASLALDGTVAAIFGVNVVSSSGSTVLDGLGPTGFPNFNSIGEGAFSILYGIDQDKIAFRTVGADAGTMDIQFFDRTGGLLADLSVTLGSGTEDWVFTSDFTDIGGITIDNANGGGIGFDNFGYSPVPVPGALILGMVGLAALRAVKRRLA